MIFIDSNIPMYLIGAPHPHKVQAQRILTEALSARVRLVTDAEVFQEILHRYAAIRRREAIEKAFDVLSRVVDEVFPIDMRTITMSHSILMTYPQLNARDCLHVASMRIHNVYSIMSFDAYFDHLSPLRRIF